MEAWAIDDAPVALAEASPCYVACMPEGRRFPPPWSVDEPDPKLQQQCFIEDEVRLIAAHNTAVGEA
jgi:hypothetical protein